jgi:subtilisin family serine protease
VKADLTRQGAKVYKTFNSDVFTGLTIESTTSTADSLSLAKDVARAWPVSRYKIDPLLSVNNVKFEDLEAANYSVHSMTGVDKVHASGVTGKGVVVGVVDSGVDYRHSAVSRNAVVLDFYQPS